MDTGFRTPLLDFFRRGDVARDIRLLAAQGGFAPRAHEQLGLLALLVEDADPEIAAVAEATLQEIPRDSLEAFLARSDVPVEIRTFFAARGIEPAAAPALDADAPLFDPAPEPEAEDDGEAAEQDEGSALLRISSMTVPQKMKRAMKGSREERSILIRDPNKIVALAVLSSPKMSETEIGAIARMTNVSDEILRLIANTRAWVKNYSVVWSLTKNPKTPVAISMNMLQRLTEKDLRAISSDRNVPDALRIMARKKLVIDK